YCGLDLARLLLRRDGAARRRGACGDGHDPAAEPSAGARPGCLHRAGAGVLGCDREDPPHPGPAHPRPGARRPPAPPLVAATTMTKTLAALLLAAALVANACGQKGGVHTLAARSGGAGGASGGDAEQALAPDA